MHVLSWGFVGFLGVAWATPADAAVSLQVSDAQVDPGVGAKLLQNVFHLSPEQAAAGGPQIEAKIAELLPTLLSSFNTEINSRFAALDTAGVLRAMANAGSGAARLLPTDYATDASVASLSVGGGVAGNSFALSDLHLSSLNTSDGQLLERGISGAAGASLTFHLRSLDLPRWRYFDPARLTVGASFMRAGPYEIDSDVSIGVSNWGARLSYQLLTGHSWAHRGMARWGGLHLGLGVAQNSLNFRFKGLLPNVTPPPVTFSEADQQVGLSVLFKSDADLHFGLRSWTLPLEVWSHLQLGYLFTLYGGLGLDYNVSSAHFAADLQSQNVQIQGYEANNAGSQSITVAQPDIRLDAADLGLGVAWDARTFVGLQVNLFYLALFAQASVDTSHNVAANVGLRAFY